MLSNFSQTQRFSFFLFSYFSFFRFTFSFKFFFLFLGKARNIAHRSHICVCLLLFVQSAIFPVLNTVNVAIYHFGFKTKNTFSILCSSLYLYFRWIPSAGLPLLFSPFFSFLIRRNKIKMQIITKKKWKKINKPRINKSLLSSICECELYWFQRHYLFYCIYTLQGLISNQCIYLSMWNVSNKKNNLRVYYQNVCASRCR